MYNAIGPDHIDGVYAVPTAQFKDSKFTYLVTSVWVYLAGADGNPASVYYLTRPVHGAIPADPADTPASRSWPRANTTFAATTPGTTATRIVWTYVGNVRFSGRAMEGIPVPARRVDYFSAADGVRWQTAFDQNSFLDPNAHGQSYLSDLHGYKAGSQVEERWNGGIQAVGLSSQMAAFREGDTMYRPFQSAANGNLDLVADTTSGLPEVKLWRNGELVSQDWSISDVPADATPADYRLTVEHNRDMAPSSVSTSVRAEWRFRSQTTAHRQALPLYAVRMSPKLDEWNRAEAGRKLDIPVLIQRTARRPGVAHPRLHHRGLLRRGEVLAVGAGQGLRHGAHRDRGAPAPRRGRLGQPARERRGRGGQLLQQIRHQGLPAQVAAFTESSRPRGAASASSGSPAAAAWGLNGTGPAGHRRALFVCRAGVRPARSQSRRAACQPSCIRVATPARLIRPWMRRWTVRLLTRSCPAIASSVMPATIRESRCRSSPTGEAASVVPAPPIWPSSVTRSGAPISQWCSNRAMSASSRAALPHHRGRSSRGCGRARGGQRQDGHRAVGHRHRSGSRGTAPGDLSGAHALDDIVHRVGVVEDAVRTGLCRARPGPARRILPIALRGHGHVFWAFTNDIISRPAPCWSWRRCWRRAAAPVMISTASSVLRAHALRRCVSASS